MIRNIVKQGWKTSVKHPGLLALLFVYQLGWGFFVFRFVQSVVDPLLRRYPAEQLDPAGNYLFWAEAQFRLLKTDLAWSYVWALAAMLLARIVVAPLIDAGLYYSIHYGTSGRKRLFWQGIKAKAKPFAVVHALRSVALAAPLCFLLPGWYELLMRTGDWRHTLATAAPWLAGYVLYAGLLKLACMYIQFAVAADHSIWQALKALAVGCVSAVGASLAIGAIFIAVMAASSTVSLWMAGLMAVVFHQLYHLIRSWFAVWTIGAQHALWNEKL